MRVGTPSLIDASSLILILDVSRKLAAPCDLTELLELIIKTGREVIGADRGSVFLYDEEEKELYSRVATGETQIRVSIDKGIAGECARRRQTIVVDDCYADPRFNPDIDRRTGYHTKSLITVPLIGLDDKLVGVLQMLNSAVGHFGPDERDVAELLAAQAAVAVQRTLLLEERMIKIKLEHDLTIARDIQQNILLRRLPRCPGYSLSAFSKPADDTGGDIYDVIRLDERSETSPLLLLLADAAGHGIGPALSITQFRAMLRIGLRLSADMDALMHHINQQLIEDLPNDRFITAFLGILDPTTHQLRYHAAGQGPLLHYRAAEGQVVWRDPSTVPLGMFKDLDLPATPPLVMAPGDLLVLLTDGFYEYQDAAGQVFGKERVGDLIHRLHARPTSDILGALLAEVRRFAGTAKQIDDLTALLVKRDA
ncbi:PP2C family protein-serine/threonine phosphatase [Sorangium sp. So ce1024]|jgi:sigma-B regulation protein RsbU (phosphoserine phosphatase)|uniref:PP2C family protein-serine/threonine phosphatase n=1 Tax=unclassified Sorangium TaxID=2621164 RepID=UPI003F00F5FF